MVTWHLPPGTELRPIKLIALLGALGGDALLSRGLEWSEMPDRGFGTDNKREREDLKVKGRWNGFNDILLLLLVKEAQDTPRLW